MDLNLFENKYIKNNFVSKFIEELKSSLNKTMCEKQNEKDNVLEEYNLYERKKIFLDNKSWKGNDLAWVMDEKSICLSEHGSGGPYAITEIDLPKNAKVGEVYEKIDEKFIYNPEITMEVNNIGKTLNPNILDYYKKQ